jgi:protein required for attachment to host cells
MLVPHDVLIFVLDGGHMALFRNVGSVTAPTLKLVAKNEVTTPSTAELGSDRPGRAFQSVGHGRAAYEVADLHQKSEDGFIGDATQLVCTHMTQPGQRAIIIAPPQVLGQVRDLLKPEVHAHVIAEIGKDYVSKTPLELVDLLDRYEG